MKWRNLWYRPFFIAAGLDSRDCCFLVIFLFSEVRFIFNTTIIKETKTAAIMEPATLLSMELSAFQNQIEKRTSTTKSITARSEYGVDILDGSILVFLNSIFAKLSSPQKCKEGRRWNLLITLTQGSYAVLGRGKMFRGSEMSWVKFFGRPYLYRILLFKERE